MIWLGPAVCQKCRGRVWWGTGANGKGRTWRDRDGSRHACWGIR